ncbi:MAG: hypothetical protein RIQ52_585 [Pseudomonadota bacterium]
MRSWWLSLWLVATLSACLYIVLTVPFSEWVSAIESLRPRLMAEGGWAVAEFVLAATLLMQIGFPRLLVFSLGGFFFGFFPGILWGLLASVVGALLTFYLVRHAGWLRFTQRYPRLHAMAVRLESHGIWAVVVLRQLPMSGYLNNILLGMTTLAPRDFFWGTVLGYLPLGAAFCLVGAGLMKGNNQELVWVALPIFLVSMLLARWLGRHALPESGR